jgi:hypothetical protein
MTRVMPVGQGIHDCTGKVVTPFTPAFPFCWLNWKHRERNEMKKVLIATLVIFMLVTAACGSTSTVKSSSGRSSAGMLSTAAEIAVGSMKLDGTAQAITSTQAAELLPLWYLYKQLLNSDTAAQQEIDATMDAIQSAMTAEQLQAIAEMDLTGQDMLSYIQSSSSTQKGGSSNQSVSSGGGAGGDMGGGLPPDMAGGDGIMMAGVSSGQSTSTQSSSQSSVAVNSSQIPSALVDAIIQMLEKRAVS